MIWPAWFDAERVPTGKKKKSRHDTCPLDAFSSGGFWKCPNPRGHHQHISSHVCHQICQTLLLYPSRELFHLEDQSFQAVMTIYRASLGQESLLVDQLCSCSKPDGATDLCMILLFLGDAVTMPPSASDYAGRIRCRSTAPCRLISGRHTFSYFSSWVPVYWAFDKPVECVDPIF